jgi:predicted ATPase with chaperone activity
MNQPNLSVQANNRIPRLVHNIADLAGSDGIQSTHLAEALHASQPSEVDDGMIAK